MSRVVEVVHNGFAVKRRDTDPPVAPRYDEWFQTARTAASALSAASPSRND